MYSCIDYVSVLAGRSSNLKIQQSDKYLYALGYLKIRKRSYNNIIIIIIIIIIAGHTFCCLRTLPNEIRSAAPEVKGKVHPRTSHEGPEGE
jgi:hypothetical protein